MTVRQYATALAFKQALEQRLKTASTTGADFARRRQLLVFERFLARLAQVAGEAMTLKGGLVLELRLARARTTKDVDLQMMGSSTAVLARLQEAGLKGGMVAAVGETCNLIDEELTLIASLAA